MAYKKFKNIKKGDTLYTANVSGMVNKINIEEYPVKENAKTSNEGAVIITIEDGSTYAVKDDCHVMFGQTSDGRAMCVSTSHKACHSESKKYLATIYAKAMKKAREEDIKH